MCDVAEQQRLPRMLCREGRNFGPVFQLLRSQIASDVNVLRSNGLRLRRPIVLFLTSGPPDDSPEAWRGAFHRLVSTTSGSSNRFSQWPIVIPFGVEDADPDVLSE